MLNAGACDADGNLIATINANDQNGGRNTFAYDLAGQRTEFIDPLNRRTTSGYDPAGRQTLRIDARGFPTTYLYDPNGRLTERRYRDGSRHTFAYDANGQRTLMANATGRYTSTYDELNRVRTANTPQAGVLTFTYDAVGNPACPRLGWLGLRSKLGPRSGAEGLRTVTRSTPAVCPRINPPGNTGDDRPRRTPRLDAVSQMQRHTATSLRLRRPSLAMPS